MGLEQVVKTASRNHGTRRSFAAIARLQADGIADWKFKQQPANSISDSNSSSSTPPLKIIRSVSSSQSPVAGPVLRRTSSATNAAEPGLIIRRTSSPNTSSGQILRRTRSPAGSGETPNVAARTPNMGILRRTGSRVGGGQGVRRDDSQQRGSPRGGRGGGGAGKPDKRRRRTAKVDQEEGEDGEVADDNPNPTVELPYDPQDHTIQDLRADWPDTPISATGLSETVTQKLNILARRLPHGYRSAQDQAQHYLKGNLTKFESTEEKTKVIELAAKLSAQQLQAENDGTAHKFNKPFFPALEDAGFASLDKKDGEMGALVAPSVRGEYPAMQKQKFAFMDQVARSLANNGTYGPAESQKLMDRIAMLIPQQQPGQKQGEKQKQKQK